MRGAGRHFRDYYMIPHNKIQTVLAKQAQIDEIYAEIDVILDPLCREVMARGDVQEIEALLNQLPAGFHRTELRTYLNKVKDANAS
jgi:hypothetical protein